MTDWDAYYRHPPPTASLTRHYTKCWLVESMHRHTRTRPLEIIELGGGNSFCCRTIVAALAVTRYDIADFNEGALAMFLRKMEGTGVASAAVRTDLLTMTPPLEKADIVFSVGLVEHFTPKQSLIVAARHFDLVRPGGVVIITAPTPTLPYRVTRWLAERAGAWAFPDERPMEYREVENLDHGRGKLLAAATLWPLVLTQRAVAWRAFSPA